MVTNSSISKAQEYLKKAYRLQMQGKLKEAIENYQLSIECYPTPEAYTYLGWTYSFQGELEKAIQECKNAIALDPDFGNPYNDIGSYLIQQGKIEEAITWLELAIKSKRYETKQFAHLNLGRAYEIIGLWYEALNEYKTAIELDPNYELANTLYFSLLGRTN